MNLHHLLSRSTAVEDARLLAAAGSEVDRIRIAVRDETTLHIRRRPTAPSSDGQTAATLAVTGDGIDDTVPAADDWSLTGIRRRTGSGPSPGVSIARRGIAWLTS